MTERVNERPVNHLSRKFKAAGYDTERRVPVAALCVIKSTQRVRSLDILFCLRLGERVDHLARPPAPRGKGHADAQLAT